MGARDMTLDQLRKVVDDLEKQGCRIRSTRKGYFVYFPNGATTIYHTTPSDVRAIRNNRAFVRRQGLIWPLDR